MSSDNNQKIRAYACDGEVASVRPTWKLIGWFDGSCSSLGSGMTYDDNICVVPTPPPTSAEPTPNPTPVPSNPPTNVPSELPTPQPTGQPVTADPTPQPTAQPVTADPTPQPTAQPVTAAPTPQPTPNPTPVPSNLPTNVPTELPTPQPTAQPVPVTAAPTNPVLFKHVCAKDSPLPATICAEGNVAGFQDGCFNEGANDLCGKGKNSCFWAECSGNPPPAPTTPEPTSLTSPPGPTPLTSPPTAGQCPVCAPTGLACCGNCVDSGKPSNRGCFE